MTMSFVCLHCVESEELSNWIRRNQITGAECSFCQPDEAGNDYNVCMDLERFAELCADYIRSRYISTADAEIYPDSVDGDFPVDTWTTRELVNEVFNAEGMEIRHSEICNEIINVLGDSEDTWVSATFFE